MENDEVTSLGGLSDRLEFARDAICAQTCETPQLGNDLKEPRGREGGGRPLTRSHFRKVLLECQRTLDFTHTGTRTSSVQNTLISVFARELR